MRKINKPTFSVKDVLTDCIDNVSNKKLKDALLNALDTIEDAERDFDLKKISNELSLIPQHIAVNAIVNESTLKSIYTDRMVNKQNKGRVHYDNIFLSAPNGICPLCSQRIVATLDHYLPKSLYPILSVSPLNLIPACFDCNKGKLIDYPSNSMEETLHPYYDNVDDFVWLKMRIIQAKPFLMEYFVNPPQNIPQLLKDRIQNHFDGFNLNRLYIVHASEEFANIKRQLMNLHNTGGEANLREHLHECFDSRFSVNKNSWQTAFYGELFNNIDFCSGSFI